METDTREQPRLLIETSQFAALGTLQAGAPYVSMVLYAASPDLGAFYIHISGLAAHTRNILADPRVSLMIQESSDDDRDPQTLARISIQGTAVEIDAEGDEFEIAQSAFLERNPQTERNFGLGDFRLFEIQPDHARFIGGFGRILDLSKEDLQQIVRTSRPSSSS